MKALARLGVLSTALLTLTARAAPPRAPAPLTAQSLGAPNADLPARPAGGSVLAPRSFQAPVPTPIYGLPPAVALRAQPRQAIRGVTLGPIESTLQPGRGYGSAAFEQTLDELVGLGANWVSLTVFGRVFDLASATVEPSFEAPFEVTRDNILRSVEMAHARGLRVLLVPHLWVESGGWRAELDPGPAWPRFEQTYGDFARAWAEVAERSGVDLLAVGVELAFWTASSRAPSFVELIRDLRRVYHGPLTYAANWDDAADTIIWRDVDLIGINAFYPLHWEDNPSDAQIARGAQDASQKVGELGERWGKPVLFTEFGYTTRKDAMVKPWLWPEELGDVTVSEEDQARAYAALLGEARFVPGLRGVFLWRMYADVADLSQEPRFGFSPWGKKAESVLRSAYRAPFWADGREASTLGTSAKLLARPEK